MSEAAVRPSNSLGTSLAREGDWLYCKENIDDFDQALRVAAVHDYLGQRRDILERVRAEGVLGLDTSPRALSASLVNRYLQIKQAVVL